MGATVSNTEIVRGLISHFFNEHDVGVAERYFADDLKWHGGLVGDIEGVRPYADVMRGFFAALPDVHAGEQDALESGNTVSMRLSWKEPTRASCGGFRRPVAASVGTRS